MPRTGLEPARLSTLAPETSASTIPPPGQAFRSKIFSFRAENEARTRDPNLGKVMLYQLSYFRKSGEGNETRTHTTILSLPPQSSASTNSAIPPDWIEISLCAVVPRTRLELARLSTLAPETSASTIPPPGQAFLSKISSFRAENEARTRDPNLGKVMLYQLSYFRKKVVQNVSGKRGSNSRP